MATLIDSYSETNQDDYEYLYNGLATARGQAFTAAAGTLDSCKFYLQKNGSPTGNIYAKVYAHTGVYGTSSNVTGAVLATSDAYDISTISSVAFELVTFSFSGAERITLSATNYFVVVEYTGGDVSNRIRVGLDYSSPSHAGNAAVYDGSWGALASVDQPFYLYEVTATLEQEGFAFGDDDNNEATHTLDTQDTNVTEPLGAKTLRVLVNATGDPASTAYTLRSQKGGSGGYTAVPVGATTLTTPVVEAGDCTESGNNTATTSWDITYPAFVAGDLLIFHLASDANVTHDWSATGPNGETVNTIKDSYGGTAQIVSGFWFVGGGTTASGSFTVTPGASEQWTAVVIKVPAGEFNATTPIQTNTGEANDTVADTSFSTPSWNADAVAGGKVMVCAAHDVVTTNAAPAGWTTLIARDRGATGITVGCRDAANTSGETIASADFTNVSSETDSSFGYIINAVSVANEVYVSASGNVTAGGEDTTARLTAPSGKTTSDFDTGRRWDNENGSDSVDITADDYTELEWVLTTQAPATTSNYFEFRVYAGSSALDTYSVTPRWTIGTGGATVVQDMLGSGIIPFAR